MAADQGFAIIPLAMVGTVSASALRVYAVLAGAGGLDQDSYPSKATIAYRAGLSSRQVQRGIAELSDEGWIRVQERYADDGTQVPNAYVVHRFQMGAA